MNEKQEKPVKIKLSDRQQHVIDCLKDGQKIFRSKFCEGCPILSISNEKVPFPTFSKLRDLGLIEIEGSTAAKDIFVLSEKGKTV